MSNPLNLENQLPVYEYMSPSYIPRHWVPFFVTTYNSQGYVRGIQTCLCMSISWVYQSKKECYIKPINS
jgi:hypothetical protein